MKQFIIQKMAVKNLTRRPVRSWSMIFFVFMLSFSLMLSTVLVDSMKDRLEKTTDRLGADIIVVPKEYERSMADSLFWEKSVTLPSTKNGSRMSLRWREWSPALHSCICSHWLPAAVRRRCR